MDRTNNKTAKSVLKKVIVFVVLGAMVFSIAACGGKAKKSEKTTAAQENQTTVAQEKQTTASSKKETTTSSQKQTTATSKKNTTSPSGNSATQNNTNGSGTQKQKTPVTSTKK